MRRKDREMDSDFALQVIENSAYAILSMIDIQGNPYGVPLSIVRKDDFLYFHSAKSGKKVETIQNKADVCVTFVGTVQVPDLFESKELDAWSKDEIKSGTFASKVFTTEYESAMVFGKVYLLEDKDEAIEGLKYICEKYTPDKMQYFDLAIKSAIAATNVYKISIENITAKRKKFDAHGEEMKHGRRE